MSQKAESKKNWLDEVKEDAAKLTLRRLEDDGFEIKKESTVKARADKAQEAEIVEQK